MREGGDIHSADRNIFAAKRVADEESKAKAIADEELAMKDLIPFSVIAEGMAGVASNEAMSLGKNPGESRAQNIVNFLTHKLNTKSALSIQEKKVLADMQDFLVAERENDEMGLSRVEVDGQEIRSIRNAERMSVRSALLLKDPTLEKFLDNPEEIQRVNFEEFWHVVSVLHFKYEAFGNSLPLKEARLMEEADKRIAKMSGTPKGNAKRDAALEA
ncbi:MAG: hypothetical protein PHO48_02920 [Candidatus Gracilibacteria bacterium]|nr:hypothetical protein [Candidatus Gracilibacteria bacterium]MDD5179056.1 hypothetical protein [Candidatus Gracilibacteria bacterium]